MTTLLLLRHGQIRANRQGRWHGSTDSALTWRGRRQVARTARHLVNRYPAISGVYTSPLERCRATAVKVAARAGHNPEVVEDLREYAIGDWEGKRFSDLAADHDFIDRTIHDPEFTPPGGESLAAVAGRIVAALTAIETRHHGNGPVVVVGHGAAFAVALGALVEGDPKHWINYQIANCGITELVLSPVPYVNLFNSTRHL